MTTFRTVTGSDFGRAIRSARSKPASGLKQAIFARLCAEAGLPAPVVEYRFHEQRRWRFDYAWVDTKVALEVEGGIFVQGRHSRGAGMLADMEKYSTAASMGWLIIRRTPSDLTSKQTIEFIKAAMVARPIFKP